MKIIRLNKKTTQALTLLSNKIFPKSKLSQSVIISTVLLILLVVALIFIIGGLVIPFVKNSLSETDCFDTIGKLEISDNNKFTCFDDSGTSGDATDDKVRVQIGIDDIELDGFRVVLGGASSKSYEIKDGISVTDVSMYLGSSTLELPNINEERTYIFNRPGAGAVQDVPDSISLIPILPGGKSCEVADSLTSLTGCSS